MDLDVGVPDPKKQSDTKISNKNVNMAAKKNLESKKIISRSPKNEKTDNAPLMVK